jgi:hypothetical protein
MIRVWKKSFLFIFIFIVILSIPQQSISAVNSLYLIYLPTVNKPYQPLSSPIGLSASTISSERIDLSWTDNNNSETAYLVDRSPNGSSSWSQITNLPANSTFYSNISLTCNSQYFYRVRAYRSNDNSYSPYSSTANATTLVSSPPAAPTNLTAITISSSEIDLAWTDNATDETANLVDRSPNGTTDWDQISYLPANVTALSNVSLTCGTQYFYRVRAYRSSDHSYSAYSNVANATTSACPPPPITGNVQITSIFYDGSGTSEPDEYVVIKNMDMSPIQLNNWTLRDEANHVFTFPSYVIQPNQECRVYTNQDHPESCGFNYHNGAAIWNNTGDCGYLRDSSSTLIDEYCY